MLVRRFVLALAVAVALALPAAALAQSNAINGSIEGTIADGQGGAVPGVAVTATNLDTGLVSETRTAADGLYRVQLLPLGTYRVKAELTASSPPSAPASRSWRADRGHQLHARGGRRRGGGFGDQRRADRRPRQDRPRPHHQRGRGQEPAAGLPQPLQLRVPAGERHRLRERGVRRGAHQRQRHADAHQLPDRRQHQHAEGPRRPAPAARRPRSWCRKSRSSPAASRRSSARRPAWCSTPSRRPAPTTSAARSAIASAARA